MFSRIYLVVSVIALAYFGLSQYRGTSPFDAFADTVSNSSRSGSHTYHK